jgi:hypothetical protein
MSAGRTVPSYLDEISARLPGSGRVRAGIVAELHAGLLDAIDACQAAGLVPDQAAAAAMREFGDPADIAAAFGPELGARHARSTALTLVTTGPVIGLLWTVAGLASHLGIHGTAPWDWAGAPPGAPVFFPLAVVILAVTVWAALLAVAATGRLTRWLPRRPRLAPATAAFAGFGFAAVDTIMLTLLGAALLTAPGRLAPVPVAAAALASLARLTLARRAARRCLALTG